MPFAAFDPARLRHLKGSAPFLAGLAVSLALLAAATLGDLYQVDARYFYLAGRMWLAGLDPYGPQFAVLAGREGLSADSVWVYPPQWWSFAAGLALLPPERAFLAWKLVNLVLLGGGGAILVSLTAGRGRSTPAAALIGFVLFLCWSDATLSGLYLGQTTFLVLVGFAALVRGLRRREPAMSGIGLFLLLLKPQFGLLFAAAALSRRELWRPLAFAVAAAVALVLPLLLSAGIGGFVQAMTHLLHDLAVYSTLKWNRPLELSGLDFLAATVGLPEVPALLYVGLAAAICLWALRRRSSTEDFWIVTVAVAVFVLPLHGYDFLLASTLLLVIATFRRWAAITLCLGLALVFRPINFAALIGARPVAFESVWPDTIAYMASYTLAGLLIFIAGLWGRREHAG